jgi:hypothetical protein
MVFGIACALEHIIVKLKPFANSPQRFQIRGDEDVRLKQAG